MTDQELKDLVASLAIDTKIMKAEADKRAADADKRAADADKRAADADKRAADADKRAAETERILLASKAEADKRAAETDRQLRELGKQIGGLSNKFGSFTEGLAMPSVKQLLFDRFAVDTFMPWLLKRHGSQTVELDALGILNGSKNEAYIVEIKSHLRNEAIDQLLDIMQKFRLIFPEYAQMKLYGLIAAAHASNSALELARNAGFYVLTFEHNLMRFHDELGFVPKAY